MGFNKIQPSVSSAVTILLLSEDLFEIFWFCNCCMHNEQKKMYCYFEITIMAICPLVDNKSTAQPYNPTSLGEKGQGRDIIKYARILNLFIWNKSLKLINFVKIFHLSILSTCSQWESPIPWT